MMQFKVPQDVLRPDKVVGFLTLRQVIIAALGGGLAYSLFLILSKQYFIEVWLPPVFFIVIVTLAFAFFRFHDIPFEKLVLIFIEYQFRPRIRVWEKMQGDVFISSISPLTKKPLDSKSSEKEMLEEERRKKLEEISKIVDAHGKFGMNNKQ